MHRNLKTILCLMLIYTLTLLTTACPARGSAIRQAAKASHSLSGLTLDAVKTVGEAYAAGHISAETRSRLGAALEGIAIGGKRFNQAVETFAASGEKPTADKMAWLNVLFSDGVVTPFMEILQLFKVLSPAAGSYLSAAINALRGAILVIAGGFEQAGVRTARIGGLSNA